MPWWNRVRRIGSSIGIRLFSGFLAVVLVTVLIVLVAIGRISWLSSISEELIQREVKEVKHLLEIGTLLSEMEIDLQHLIHQHLEQETYLIRTWEKEERIQESLVAFRKLHSLLPEEEEQLLGELTTHFRAFQEAMVSVTTFVQPRDETKATVLFLRRWEELRQATLANIMRLLDYEDRQVEERIAFVQANSHLARRIIITLAVGGIFLSLALALGITFSLTRPLTKLIKLTERVTQGDLASKAEILSEDEIGLLARRFNEMLDRLNQSFKNQRRFYADASHELRTPLTIVRGEAEVALRGSEKSVQEYRETLETINAVASQMGRLVDELLFLARSEAGQIPYEMTQFALPQLLTEMARQSEGLAALKEVCMELDVRRPLVIRGDVQRLRQLFFILTDNAIKYTNPGGKVTLALKVDPDWARVLVSDTGVGIPKQDLPHIFERSFRANAVPPGFEGGTGLGLSIAKSIVKAHQGEICVESVLGRGTTFSVLLPYASSGE